MLHSFKKGTPEKGWVVLIHGLGEHIGRYEKLVSNLVNRNFGVIGFDLPGHGKSPGKRGHTSIEKVLKIIDELTDTIDKFFIFGHSLGGLIAIRYAQENNNKIRGLIASSPALHIKTTSLKKFLSNVLDLFVPSITMSNGIDPELLSRNKEAVENYLSDELVHDRISVRLGKSLLKNIKLAHEKVGLIFTPTLLLVGTKDRITPITGSILFYNDLQVMDKKIIRFDGGFHELFEDPEHGEEFYNIIYNWLEEHAEKR
ncbi:lysophospholipase [Thermosipho ferrireducens]|uniref:Lysophospholipase n=1 Tax=Thermosipho ferrireducens TaxID=2571116 RepID=A0ABX7S430_9BACT|nr:alpha/beta hydrolase [Thermosipho ferrireducens]QTA37122.1 lysophospholipase [Thermosipho ferrireducens]